MFHTSRIWPCTASPSKNMSTGVSVATLTDQNHIFFAKPCF